MSAHPTPDDTREWLRGRPSLTELRAAYPDEWVRVERELAALAPGELKAYLTAPAVPPASVKGLAREQAVIRAQVRRQMAAEAVRQVGVSAATGVKRGTLRFGRVNGTIAQRLLFAHGLVRKPVSMRAFRLLWPLVWQRARLMPLVEPQGIYCFYSRELIERLAELVDGRRCLEIAAGDGTLSRFLRDAGVDVVATDDHSWEHTIDFPEDVQRQDAAAALREHRPEVVLCSWPPPDNAFERQVFATPSVEQYVVISSQHRFGTGDTHAYRDQTAFDAQENRDLSRLVLPPEIDPAVYQFRRRQRPVGWRPCGTST